jgi:hypothetical protein
MEQREISINETVFTDGIKRHIERIPEELRLQSDKELEKQFKPSANLYRIRQAFWKEIAIAEERNKKIRPKHIYTGIVSEQYFFDKILRSDLKLAWIISPLATYEDMCNAILQKGMQRYEELIDIDINVWKKRKNEDGEWVEYRDVCPKKAAVLLAAIKNVEERVKGLAVQRQIVHKTEEKKVRTITEDPRELAEKIKELENKLNGGDVKVEVVE